MRDAYGVRAETTEVVVPFGYTGHAEDPTGLAWGRARYLEHSTGMWLGEDPVPSEPRYCYVGGAASLMVDPTGTSSYFEWRAVIAGRTIGIALHPGHHYWRVAGYKLFCVHVQLLYAVNGVKGSGVTYQIPLPFCSRTKF